MENKIRILIVDDEEIMRNLFNDILQEEGYAVTVASGGKEAEELAQKSPFDIAFIDVHMPVMDGIKTLRSLKKISPKTTVVMTDSMPHYTLEESKKEGAATCIHKPFNIREVRSVVDKIVKSRQTNP